jgi:hypothetical protein
MNCEQLDWHGFITDPRTGLITSPAGTEWTPAELAEIIAEHHEPDSPHIRGMFEDCPPCHEEWAQASGGKA